MEGQSDQEPLLQLMSLNFGGNANNVSCGPEDDPNQHFPGDRPNVLPLLQWTHFQNTPRNYVEFLAENSTFLENATGADMLETITSPIFGVQSVYGVPETPRELSFNNPRKVGYHHPCNELESAQAFTGFQPQIITQNCTPLTQEPYQDTGNVSPLHPREKLTPIILPSKRCPKSSLSRQKAAATDRDRRVRISERLRSLQELLPNSAEVGQAAVMEEIIDHIKFLQLQLKGYGHYVLNEEMTNEPLEEMMGKLLERNPLAASQLLESRGLYMMPMSLAELHQVS